MSMHTASIEDVAPAVSSQDLAVRHVRSELTNQTDTILATITATEPLLTAVIEQRPGGQQLTICSTVAQQRRHYEENRAEIQALDAEIYTSVGSDWYAFLHGNMTVRKLANGELRSNEWVGLFPIPAGAEAIGGEIGLSWPPVAKRGDETGSPSTSRGATIRAFEGWLACGRAGDAEGLAGRYAPDALAAVRPVDGQAPAGLRGRDEIRSVYARLFSSFGVESVDVLTRVVDRWFLFAELAWVMSDRDEHRVTRRTAHVMVMTESDDIAIDLGYGTDLMALTPVAHGNI
jgi:ketosteroid isomerase-like protein